MAKDDNIMIGFQAGKLAHEGFLRMKRAGGGRCVETCRVQKKKEKKKKKKKKRKRKRKKKGKRRKKRREN
jgi:hypothetical protein